MVVCAVDFISSFPFYIFGPKWGVCCNSVVIYIIVAERKDGKRSHGRHCNQ